MLHSSNGWVNVACMEQIPTTESYVQKVIRIAKELEISIDKASIICDAFELAFRIWDRGRRSLG